MYLYFNLFCTLCSCKKTIFPIMLSTFSMRVLILPKSPIKPIGLNHLVIIL